MTDLVAGKNLHNRHVVTPVVVGMTLIEFEAAGHLRVVMNDDDGDSDKDSSDDDQRRQNRRSRRSGRKHDSSPDDGDGSDDGDSSEDDNLTSDSRRIRIKLQRFDGIGS